MEVPLGFLDGPESSWAALMSSTQSAQSAIRAVRYVIDVLEPGELADDIILSAIRRAAHEVLAQRAASADVNSVRLAILHLAAYYSYQSYSDRVTHLLPGSFSQDGTWNPVASVIVRETQAKLRELRENADRMIRIISAIPKRSPGFATISILR